MRVLSQMVSQSAQTHSYRIIFTSRSSSSFDTSKLSRAAKEVVSIKNNSPKVVENENENENESESESESKEEAKGKIQAA